MKPLPHRWLTLWSLTLLTVSLALVPTSAGAATATGSDELSRCMQQSFQALAKQQRLFRVVLLGRRPAAASPQGTVWYDDEGVAWTKNDESTWITVPKNKPTRSDGEMDDKVETDPEWTSPFRRGLLETRTTLTSSLLPPVIQAYRALQCRLETVCGITTGEVLGDGGLEAIDGCEPPSKFGLTSMTACTFTTESAARDSIEASSFCRQAVDGMLAHEAEALRLVVAYDAAVRTSLQYAGIFDRLIRDLRYPLLWPLIELSGLVQELNRIPCFLGFCAP